MTDVFNDSNSLLVLLLRSDTISVNTLTDVFIVEKSLIKLLLTFVTNWVSSVTGWTKNALNISNAFAELLLRVENELVNVLISFVVFVVNSST